MTKFNKLLIGVVGVVVVVGFALGVFGFIKGSQNAQDDPAPLPNETASIFGEELANRALARGPHPIEGFDALMFLDVFPGLQESDFDGVATGAGLDEGMHTYVDGELRWERTSSQPTTSAERTISEKGYEALLENLSQRLGMPASTAEEVIAIVDEIDSPVGEEDIPSDINDHILSKRDHIIVNVPSPLSVVSSPLTVRGEARGTWYFEGDFQLTLVDWNGRIIAESYATAQNEWMTEEFVPFEGTIEFEPEEESRVYNRGTLIFQKANPTGLPEHDDALEIPVLFEEKDSMEENISVRGETVCLPKRGTGPQTLECAIGLRAQTEGVYYALENLSEYDFEFRQTGMEVEVTGKFVEEERLGPDGNPYDIAGVIIIENIQR